MGQLLCVHFGKKVTVNGVAYDVIRGIGEGAFSFVQLVRKGSVQYALKRILIQVPERLEMVNREVNAHETIKHNNVMPLVNYEIVEKGDNKEGRLLFPYHKLGSVQEMIEVANITQNPISEKDILKMFHSLCDAVNAFHIHEPPYAHRDIKPHNLLLCGNQEVILMDLGSVREARVLISTRQDALALQEQCAQDCTAAYRAPELFDVPSECLVTEKTDVWSLGCTLYALAYGESPCDGSALSAISPRIIVDDNKYSRSLNELILSMLVVDPVERPNVTDLLNTVENMKQQTTATKTTRLEGIELGIHNNGEILN